LSNKKHTFSIAIHFATVYPNKYDPLTHPAASELVGHQHADEHQQHEEALDGQHPGSEEPVLLYPTGGAVLATLAARPTGETDGQGRVTHATPLPTAAVQGTTSCIRHAWG
jgi:hypothetical protein